jgi:hypothetical protein
MLYLTKHGKVVEKSIQRMLSKIKHEMTEVHKEIFYCT